MKVLVLNSSPNRDKGCTGRMVTPLIEGMRAAGADIDIAYPHRMKIGYCRGCLDNCMLLTPGRCVRRDDMDEFLPRVVETDLLVLATPVYVDGMNAAMKAVLDRMILLVKPFFVEHEGHCRHELAPGTGSGRVALVAACGFTELDNFDPLVAHVKALTRNMRREYAGALLRPGADLLPELAEAGVDVAGVYDACRTAGVELVRDGRIADATAARVSRELVPRKEYIKMIDTAWRKLAAKNREDKGNHRSD